MPKLRPAPAAIRIHGARQNNLRNLDLDLPLGELTVIHRRESFCCKEWQDIYSCLRACAGRYHA
jgi:hypothetical protein